MSSNLTLNCIQKGSGFPIFFLHGFAEDSSTWQVTFEEFAKRRTIDQYALFGVDLLGHGKSARSHDIAHYDIDFIVEKIHDLVQNKLINKQQKYIILGYSLGGRIAMHYALKYASEMQAIILEGASFGIQDQALRQERKEQDLAIANLVEHRGIEFFEKYWSGLPMFKSQINLPEKIKFRIKQRRLQNDPKVLAHVLRMLGQGQLDYIKDEFLGLCLPTLYISGALDRKYSSLAKKLKYAHIEVQIVEQAGHNVHIEKSKEYCTLLVKFLQNHCA